MDQLVFDTHGPLDDRRWMVVDETGTMVTQRNTPSLARVEVKPVAGGGLQLATEDAPSLSLPPPPPSEPLRSVEVWRDPVWGRDAGDPAAHWLSTIAGKPVRLLHLAPDKHRQRRWSDQDYTVGFADGYPLLIGNEASLADLNRRLAERDAEPVPMDRFRPNIVVAGATPWAEDGWRGLRTEQGEIRCTTGCARCTVTTVDQQSGEIRDKTEPLATLALFRKQENGVIFGRNALGLSDGARVRKGTGVSVLT